MRQALGDKGFLLSNICLAVAHWQFTVGQATFTLESLQSTISSWVYDEDATEELVPLWIFAIAIFFVYSPFAWVRKLAYFKKGYFVANCMIAIAIGTTSYFAFK